MNYFVHHGSRGYVKLGGPREEERVSDALLKVLNYQTEWLIRTEDYSRDEAIREVSEYFMSDLEELDEYINEFEKRRQL